MGCRFLLVTCHSSLVTRHCFYRVSRRGRDCRFFTAVQIGGVLADRGGFAPCCAERLRLSAPLRSFFCSSAPRCIGARMRFVGSVHNGKAELRPAPARVNCSCRPSRGTAIKKRRSERKARRSFDTAIEYVTIATMARERTRTATSTVRATCSRAPQPEASVLAI